MVERLQMEHSLAQAEAARTAALEEQSAEATQLKMQVTKMAEVTTFFLLHTVLRESTEFWRGRTNLPDSLTATFFCTGLERRSRTYRPSRFEKASPQAANRLQPGHQHERP